MKLFALAIAWIVCFPGAAQNQTQLERWVCVSSSKCQQSNDPQPEKQEFARTAKVGRWWTEVRGSIVASFVASHIDSNQNVIELRGSAEIDTGTVVVRSDEADYHWDTGDIDARGNVHVRPTPYSPAHGLSQFGVR